MPLVRISTDAVSQRCANCGALHEHRLIDLRLGVPGGSPDFVQLPKCPCGAVETLVRVYAAPPSNEQSHRKAVNALAERLKAIGRVEESFGPLYALDTPPLDAMPLEAEGADVVPTVVG